MGVKAHSLHMPVLDERLGMELFNFRRQFKLKPETQDYHQIIIDMAKDLSFSEKQECRDLRAGHGNKKCQR